MGERSHHHQTFQAKVGICLTGKLFIFFLLLCGCKSKQCSDCIVLTDMISESTIQIPMSSITYIDWQHQSFLVPKVYADSINKRILRNGTKGLAGKLYLNNKLISNFGFQIHGGVHRSTNPIVVTDYRNSSTFLPNRWLILGDPINEKSKDFTLLFQEKNLNRYKELNIAIVKDWNCNMKITYLLNHKPYVDPHYYKKIEKHLINNPSCF